MNEDTRKKRVRGLVREMKKQHQQQQQKIDLLCKDMVNAHTVFASKLEEVCFSSRLFERLISCNTKMQVYETVYSSFSSTFANLSVAFYLCSCESFQYHAINSELAISQSQIESCFSEDLCATIAKSSTVCTIEELSQMAIQDNLSLLRDATIAAIPLIKFGPSIGFVLVYRGADQPLTKMQLEMLASASSGIAKALTKQTTTLV